jgi:hypothetical protein
MGDAWINDMVLGCAYRKLHPIHRACRDNFHDNALVMTIPERLAISKEMSLLQDLWKDEKKLQKKSQ